MNDITFTRHRTSGEIGLCLTGYTYADDRTSTLTVWYTASEVVRFFGPIVDKARSLETFLDPGVA